MTVQHEELETHERHRCEGCQGDEYCDEHKFTMAQLKLLEGIPSAVSKMTGILGVIGTLFTLLVGLLFNAHFEDKKNNEMYANKIDSLSTQITNLEKDNNKSIATIKSDVLRITLTLEQMDRDNRYSKQQESKTSQK